MDVAENVTNPNLDDLPLQLFLWIAGSHGAIAPRTIEIFLRMLDNCGWCRSRWARDNLHRTHQRYAGLWNTDALSGLHRDLDALQTELRRLRQAVGLSEASLVRADLVRLAEVIARASGGFLGHASLSRRERTALLVFSAVCDHLLLAPDERVHRTTTPLPEVVTAGRQGPGPGPNVWTKGRLQVRCVQIIDETPDVKTFRLATDDESTRFAYQPGQFLTLEIRADQERLVRSYTIASSPSRPHVLEITVKRVPGGRVSNWLHDRLSVGDELTINGPAGRFSCQLAPAGDKLLLISGGSGITPVMSMSRYLHDAADPRDVVFLHSARSERDLIYRHELELLAARHPRFKPIFTLTDDAGAGWTGWRERISLPLIEAAVPDFRQRTVFLCGPTPFMEVVEQTLRSAGFPMESFHSESFGGPRTRRLPAAASQEKPAASQEPAAAPADSPAAVAADISVPAAAQSAVPSPAPSVGSGPIPSDLRPSSSQLLNVLPRPQPKQRNLRVLPPLGELTPTPIPVPMAAAPSAIVFRNSGQEARDCSQETILEAAEALGLSIPSACRAGICGTCRTRKLSGDVRMDCEDGLDAADRSAGFILACTAHPVGRVTVEA